MNINLSTEISSKSPSLSWTSGDTSNKLSTSTKHSGQSPPQTHTFSSEIKHFYFEDGTDIDFSSAFLDNLCTPPSLNLLPELLSALNEMNLELIILPAACLFQLPSLSPDFHILTSDFSPFPSPEMSYICLAGPPLRGKVTLLFPKCKEFDFAT